MLGKEHYPVFAVLGVGGISVLVYLMRQSPSAPAVGAAPAVVTENGAAPSYPNLPQITPANFIVNGDSGNLLYNTIPNNSSDPKLPVLPINVGPLDDGCGCNGNDNSCEGAGQPVSIPSIPGSVYVASQQNFAGYQAKQQVRLGAI